MNIEGQGVVKVTTVSVRWLSLSAIQIIFLYIKSLFNLDSLLIGWLITRVADQTVKKNRIRPSNDNPDPTLINFSLS